MTDNLSKLIGKGIRFPFEPSSTSGVAKSDSIDRINQSLFILFETHKGSRLMMPEFGSDIHKYRFEPFDDILIERIRETIMEDVRKWEPRIVVQNIKFLDNAEARDNQILYISINYTIVNTHVRGNYVYPFHRETYNMSEESFER